VGFFLPLSGGIDSSSTACLVGSMCDIVWEAYQSGCKLYIHSCTCVLYKNFFCYFNVVDSVGRDLREILQLADNEPLPGSAKEICR